MSLFDNTFPYTANVRFNPDYIEEVYNNVGVALMLDFYDTKREACLDDYKVTIFDKNIEVRFRELDRPLIKEIMDLICDAVNGKNFEWWVYDSVNNAVVLEEMKPSICNNFVKPIENVPHIGLGFHNPEYLNKESDNEVVVVEKKEEVKEVPLNEYNDMEIAKCLEKNGCETKIQSDIWKFTYDPEDPLLFRFSYGTFENCTIPLYSFQFTEKKPLTIQRATFVNVNFEKCRFLHVIFLNCSFINCDFTNSAIQHLTFDSCFIENTNIDFPNVYIV